MPRQTTKRAVSRTTRSAKLKAAATRSRDTKLALKLGTMYDKPRSQSIARESRRMKVDRGGGMSRTRKQRESALQWTGLPAWFRPRAGIWGETKRKGK